jgi:hypothetical protein
VIGIAKRRPWIDDMRALPGVRLSRDRRVTRLTDLTITVRLAAVLIASTAVIAGAAGIAKTGWGSVHAVSSRPPTAPVPVGNPGRADAGCPLRFDQATSTLPTACVFVGSYNPECGGDAAAVFASDGVALAVILHFGGERSSLALPGAVFTGKEAKLVGWQEDLDLQTAPSLGRVVLDSDGRSLRVEPTAPLRLGPCPITEYVGKFAGMIGGRAFEPRSGARDGR